MICPRDISLRSLQCQSVLEIIKHGQKVSNIERWFHIVSESVRLVSSSDVRYYQRVSDIQNCKKDMIYYQILPFNYKWFEIVRQCQECADYI